MPSTSPPLVVIDDKKKKRNDKDDVDYGDDTKDHNRKLSSSENYTIDEGEKKRVERWRNFGFKITSIISRISIIDNEYIHIICNRNNDTNNYQTEI